MSFKNYVTTVGRDFRFWVFLFFIIRMYGITNPPLETAHSWRQTFTCMVARNFYEIEPNILYPRIDTDGERSGIVGSEFPLFNYLIFLIAKIFGYDHWYGRLINLFISSTGIYFFYLIIRKFFGNPHAFCSGLILLCSLWFSYSRKIMPDTFSMSLVIIGLYFGLLFISSKKIWTLILFIFFSTIGGLSKLPSIIVLGVLLVPLLSGSTPKRLKILISSALVIILSIVALWYFYWVPFLQKNYGFQIIFQKDIITGISEILNYWGAALEKFYFGALLSYIAFGMFLLGLFFAIKNKSKAILGVFIIGFLIFVFFAIKTGAVFPTHSYYIIPFVPFMAFIAGYGISSIQNRYFKVFILSAIIIESLANQQHDFKIKDKDLYMLDLEALCDKVLARNDLVAFSGGPNFMQMYFAHRRGWSLDSGRWNDPGYLSSIKQKGCKLLFINKKDSSAKLNYKIIFENENYTVYKL